MARMGLFGNRTREPDTVEEAGDAKRTTEADATATQRIVKDRPDADRSTAGLAVADRTHRAGRTTSTDREATDRTAADRTALDRAATDRTAIDQAAADRAADQRAAERRAAERDAIDHETAKRDTVERPAPEPKVRARTSLFATIALIVGLTGVYSALSGRLAPVALVLGVIGLVFSFGGLTATGRPRITGSGMAFLGLLLSVGGGVLAVLAMNHTTTWLDSDVDQIERLRGWLDTQLPFIRNW